MGYRLPAYAKINLGLRVLGKRGDGYHEIVTLMQQVDLHDDLVFEQDPKGTINLHVQDSPLPVDERNLCWQAAELLRRTYRVRSGARIVLVKRIPVGAGLGGGSSDAAATLLGLNRLWRLNLRVTQIEPLASKLGSDVPFFVQGGTAWATGRGEKLRRVHLPTDYWVLIVYPEFSISTSDAYNQLSLSLTNEAKPISFESLKLTPEGFRRFCGQLQNDLEEVVFARYSSLARIKKRLVEEGAFFSSMTGSGSAIFGLFDHEQQAQEASQALGAEFRTWVVRPIHWGFQDVIVE